MEVRAEISYPDAEPAQVFALAVDHAFRVAVCEATRALSHRVEIDARPDGGAQVTVERTLAAEVPDFVRTFIGQTVTIVQTEKWAAQGSGSGRVADLHIQFRGQPASMSGSEQIEAAGAGTRQLIRGDLTVSVPFVGRRIETEVAKAILAAAAKEQETGRAWLLKSA
jgi:Protein of unknown function (DUF2505)